MSEMSTEEITRLIREKLNRFCPICRNTGTALIRRSQDCDPKPMPCPNGCAPTGAKGGE